MASALLILLLFISPIVVWFFLVLSPVLFLPILVITPFAWVFCREQHRNSLVIVEARPLSILLIDDDPSSLVILEQVLAAGHQKYEVITDSKLGSDLMGQRQFDLVILDNDMPELSGPEALVRADNLVETVGQRARSPGHLTPVIGYSGLERANWRLPNLKHFQLIGMLSKATLPSKLKKDLEGVFMRLETLAA